MTPNEVWNFLANGNTRLEPVQNNYFGSQTSLIRMPAFWSQCMTPEQFHTGICGISAKKISLDGWKNRHDLPWEHPLRPHALDCDSTPVGPAGQQVFMHYVIWGLKHLLRQITIATFSSGTISIAVGVFHLHSFRLQMLVHPSFSAALGVSLIKDGKLVQHRLILI